MNPKQGRHEPTPPIVSPRNVEIGSSASTPPSKKWPSSRSAITPTKPQSETSSRRPAHDVNVLFDEGSSEDFHVTGIPERPRRIPDRAATLRSVLITAAAVCLCACGGGSAAPEGADGEWHVERTVDGTTTTVRNLSGSKWGGNATLELVLEIGVDEGDERYMFGQPSGFWATDDEIFVLEQQDRRVRVYGRDGTHRRDFGRSGQGPGEFENPYGVIVMPGGEAAVLQFAGPTVKASVFSPDGQYLEDWQLMQMTPGGTVFPSPSVTLPFQNTLLLGVRERSADPTTTSWELRVGLQEAGSEGLLGEPRWAPPLQNAPATYDITFGQTTRPQPVPWSVGRPIVGALSTGEMVWTHADAYRFHIVSPAGTTTVVERSAEPVPVDPEEAEYRRAMMVRAFQRQQNADFSWDGSGIPATKPWIRLFAVDHHPSGRIWVSREGPGRRADPCTSPQDWEPGQPATQCWTPQPLMDIFDRDGSFLGSLDRPEGLSLFAPFIRGELMVAGHLDEFGVYKVRLYRIVLPPAAGR